MKLFNFDFVHAPSFRQRKLAFSALNFRGYHLSPFTLLLAASMLFACCKPDNPAPEPAPDEKIEMPRYIAADGGKIYVTCYRPASVIRIDTATREVEAKCLLGTYNPEGIVVAGGKMFAVSSWNQTENGAFLYDDKVYVIDLATFTVSTTITVGLNPQRVKILDDGHVIVNYNGNYVDQPAGTAIIDVNTLSVKQTGQPMASMSVFGGKVYGYSNTYDADWNSVVEYVCYDPAVDSVTKIVCREERPYSINVINGKIYLTTDGNYRTNGDVMCFELMGDSLVMNWQSEAGMLPNKMEPIGDGNAYVLNEGNYGSNNSSLSLINLASGAIENDVFSTAYGRGLGDLAQDVVVYGAKAYITVSTSNTIEVMNLTDNKSIQIKL